MRHSILSRFFSVFLFCAAAALTGCSPLGVATGAGAAIGVASQQEGGIEAAASDLEIKALISDQWFRYDVATFAKLNLTVRLGRVLITGVVQNPDQRVEAVRLAWKVKGVKQIINEIKVAGSEGIRGMVSDEWITARLRASLTFDRDVRSINYSIDTVQGIIYLMGNARSQAELDRVIEIARTISGVLQVVSYVTIPQAAPMAAPSKTSTAPRFVPGSQVVAGPQALSPAHNPAPVTRAVLPP